MSEQKMREALADMVAVARAEGWAEAQTGRQIVLRAAEEAISEHPVAGMKLRDDCPWMVFNIGCIECGVSSGLVGLYASEDEAIEAAIKLQECHDWREGGENSYEVFDLRANPSAEYAEAIAAHEAKKEASK